MKAPRTEIARPATLAEALALLATEDARILAGGQSLGAALNLRLDAPALLVDINGIPGLDRITLEDGHLVFGPLVRHRAVLESPLVAREVPVLAQVMPHVAHPAIRNRGTTAGSIAYADPAGEMPAVAHLMGAELVLASASGERVVSARDFFLGIYDTLRAPEEMLVAIRWPRARVNEHFAFGEVTRRRGDFASAGFVARAVIEAGVVRGIALTAFASEPAPVLCPAAEGAIGQRLTPLLAADLAGAIAADLDPMPSLAGSAEQKRAQARALARRVLMDLAA